MLLRLFARVRVRIIIVQALLRGPSQTDTTQMYPSVRQLMERPRRQNALVSNSSNAKTFWEIQLHLAEHVGNTSCYTSTPNTH